MGWTAPDDATPPAARRRTAQRRLFGAAFSLAAHLCVLVFLATALRSPPAPAETAPIVVELVDERPPAPAAQPKQKSTPAAATAAEARPVAAAPVPIKTPERPAVARRSLAPMKMASLAASDAVADEPGNALSEAQIAGAASARNPSPSYATNNRFIGFPLILLYAADLIGDALHFGHWRFGHRRPLAAGATLRA